MYDTPECDLKLNDVFEFIAIYTFDPEVVAYKEDDDDLMDDLLDDPLMHLPPSKLDLSFITASVSRWRHIIRKVAEPGEMGFHLIVCYITDLVMFLVRVLWSSMRIVACKISMIWCDIVSLKELAGEVLSFTILGSHYKTAMGCVTTVLMEVRLQK